MIRPQPSACRVDVSKLRYMLGLRNFVSRRTVAEPCGPVSHLSVSKSTWQSFLLKAFFPSPVSQTFSSPLISPYTTRPHPENKLQAKKRASQIARCPSRAPVATIRRAQNLQTLTVALSALWRSKVITMASGNHGSKAQEQDRLHQSKSERSLSVENT